MTEIGFCLVVLKLSFSKCLGFLRATLLVIFTIREENYVLTNLILTLIVSNSLAVFNFKFFTLFSSIEFGYIAFVVKNFELNSKKIISHHQMWYWTHASEQKFLVVTSTIAFNRVTTAKKWRKKFPILWFMKGTKVKKLNQREAGRGVK